jgi:hypothetical protein
MSSKILAIPLLALILQPYSTADAGNTDNGTESALQKSRILFEETLPQLETEFDRALLCTTAATVIGNDAPEVSMHLLEKVRSYGLGGENSLEYQIILKKLVTGFAGVEPYQALLLAENISDEGEREFLLSEIAVPVLSVDRKLAFSLADSLEIPIHRIDARSAMASELIASEPEAAKKLLISVAEDFPHAQPRVDALDAAGEFLPLMHDLGMEQFTEIKDTAIGELNDLRDQEELSRAQTALAPVVAINDVEEALALIEDTPQIDYRAVATAKIGAIIRENNRSRSSLLFKHAIDLASTGGSGYFLEDPLPDVARVIAPFKPEQAFGVALSTGDRAVRLEVCREILSGSDEESGLEMMQSLVKGDYVSYMLTITFYARHPELPEASEKIESAIENFYDLHDFLLMENLPVFLEDLAIWDPERAMELAKKIDDPQVKLSALAGIMASLAG